MAELITIFGGSGFVGRYVVSALARHDARIRVATRDPHGAQFLKPLTQLGQLGFVPADFSRPATVVKAVEGADAVINLVGLLDAGEDEFRQVHVEGPKAAAEAAAAAGVGSFVHVGAIGADEWSEAAYARTKALGESAVRSAFPAATIIRPSIVFGPEDDFLNRFAALIRALPAMPVLAPETKFQPVYVADLADVIAKAVLEPADHTATTYEIGGPETISMRALMAWIAVQIGKPDYPLIDVPDGVAGALAALTGWLPGAPITGDQWLMLQSDNIVSGEAQTIDAFGIVPTPMEAVAPGWLVRFKPRGRFS